MKRKFSFLKAFIFFTFLFHEVDGHQLNQTYVYLQVYDHVIQGRVEFRKSDIVRVNELNVPESVKIDEIGLYAEVVQKYILNHLSFRSQYGSHKILFDRVDTVTLNPTDYLAQFQFRLEGTNPRPDYLDVQNTLFTEELVNHQAWVIIEHFWKAGILNNESLPSHIFTIGDTEEYRVALDENSISIGIWALIKLGIKHIWIGFDHLLFLAALLLPAVVFVSNPVVRNNLGIIKYTDYTPVDKFRSAFIMVLKIVTLFTVAHTITLSLAALGIVVLPSRLVEAVIAISIALAALHNIYPVFVGKEWIIVFGFGLFHGFGFASVLAEKMSEGQYLAYSLFGFNVGVEIGQVVVIFLVFPFLFLIRKWEKYSKYMAISSIILVGFSIYWLTERVLDTEFWLSEFMGQFLRDVYYGRI